LHKNAVAVSTKGMKIHERAYYFVRARVPSRIIRQPSASIPASISASAAINQALLVSPVPVRGKLAGTIVGVGVLPNAKLAVAVSSPVAVIAIVVGVRKSGVGISAVGVACRGFGCGFGVAVAVG
jgi:hypothetical protein